MAAAGFKPVVGSVLADPRWVRFPSTPALLAGGERLERLEVRPCQLHADGAARFQSPWAISHSLASQADVVALFDFADHRRFGIADIAQRRHDPAGVGPWRREQQSAGSLGVEEDGMTR